MVYNLAEVGVQVSNAVWQLFNILCQQLVGIRNTIVKIRHFVESKPSAHQHDKFFATHTNYAFEVHILICSNTWSKATACIKWSIIVAMYQSNDRKNFHDPRSLTENDEVCCIILPPHMLKHLTVWASIFIQQ